MQKSDVEDGLQELANEVAEAQARLSRGDGDIGLENVGPRIQKLCNAALNLPDAENKALQPLMTKVRDDLVQLSSTLDAILTNDDSAPEADDQPKPN